MVVTCEEVWREISNYIEQEADPVLRAAMEEHFRQCKHCTAVLDGTRNVIQLYGDERLLEVPAGFSGRLRRRLEQEMPAPRGNAWGWMVAVAAAAVIVIGGVAGRSSAFNTPLRSEHAKPAPVPVPADMMVVVADDGKTFHAAGCRFIHDKAHLRTIAAGEAIREGYAPCMRCMRKYLQLSALAPAHANDPDDAVNRRLGF
jgi:Putative zinc-finger